MTQPDPDAATPGGPCPDCGSPIPPDAPEGLCPQCLLHGAAEETLPDFGGRPSGLTDVSLEEVSAAFPHLEILERIGEGGMGVVFKARQTRLDRLVALKLLRVDEDERQAFASRFLTEARALARLNHPHIVAVHDFGQVGELYFLLMEYVDGVNLRQAMDEGRCGPEDALAIVPVICEALQFAHDRGVLHRDIKPANILLSRDGSVKIADFGLAKFVGDGAAPTGLTHTEATLGTPVYMAPEQVESPARVDHRADIYSLGVVLYEMLTGELPLGRFPVPSERSTVDRRVDDVVMRTLEKEPDERFQSAREMGSQVEHVSSPGLATGPAAGPGPAPSAVPEPADAADTKAPAAGSRSQGRSFSWMGLAGSALVATAAVPVVLLLLASIIAGGGIGVAELLIVLAGSGLFGLAGTALGWAELANVRRGRDRPAGLFLAWTAAIPVPALLVVLLALVLTSIGVRMVAVRAGSDLIWPAVGLFMASGMATALLVDGLLLLRARQWVYRMTPVPRTRWLLIGTLVAVGLHAVMIAYIAFLGIGGRPPFPFAAAPPPPLTLG